MRPSLTAIDIGAAMGPDLDWDFVPVTGSTQTDLLTRARALAPGRPRLLVAREQTAGRGRRGRSWLAQPDDALTFSLAVPWSLPLAQTPAVTLSLAVALARTLWAQDIPVQLKWPNDLLLEGRKLAGLLVEFAQDPSGAGSLVIGLGINLHLSPTQRARIDQAAAALDEVAGLPAPRDHAARWLALLTQALISGCHQYVARGFAADRSDFLRACLWLDAWVGLGGSDANILEEGYLRDIDEHGRLVLEGDDGQRRLVVAGELSLRRGAAALPRDCA